MGEVETNATAGSKEPAAPTSTKNASSAMTTAPKLEGAKKSTVRFAPESKPSRITPSRAPLISQSRQKVGKVNLKRDIPIFLGVFGALLAVTYVSKDIGKVSNLEQKGKGSRRPNIDDIRKLLVKTTEDFKREEEGRRRSTDCGLFLGDSTIPSAGLSWYAGRNFQPGDIVLDTGTELEEGVFHNELFLKHHPFMVNIERDQGQFRAIRSIQQGEELFLPVLQHPHARLGVEHPLFHNIPTSKDYILAEEIFRMEADVQLLGEKPLLHGPARLNMGNFERLAKREKSLEMVSQAVSLFNRRVANLLPSKTSSLADFFQQDRPFPYYVVQNRTIYWLELRSLCMDDVIVRDGGLVAQRPVANGALIVVAPLHIRERDAQCVTEQSCKQPTGGFCFGHARSSIQLCPVTFASHMKYSGDIAKTNAVYRFGGWNKVNRKARDMSADHLLTDLPIGLTMDIIATKDIAVGEEIVLGVTDGKLAEYGLEMSDFKFPPKWCSPPEKQTEAPDGVVLKLDAESESGSEIS